MRSIATESRHVLRQNRDKLATESRQTRDMNRDKLATRVARGLRLAQKTLRNADILAGLVDIKALQGVEQ